MKVLKIELDPVRRVRLYAYLNKWTTATFGDYPKRGAVIVCPGGAFMVHAPSEGEPVAMAFAAAGYQAFVLGYGLGSNAIIPDPICDAAASVAYIRGHAEELDVDPDKIALCGFSAGGYVAAALGTMWNREDIAAPTGEKGEAIRPDALILSYPLTLVEPIPNMVTRLLSGNNITPERFARYSPVNYVGPHMPPVFLWNIFADAMIPVETGLDFCRRLADHEVPFELHTFQHGAHGMSLASPASSLGNASLEDEQVAQWFSLACGWLKRLFGAPKLPPEAIGAGFLMPEGKRAHLGQSNLPDSLL